MTEILIHDYGKGKVTRTQIRAAIRSVRAASAVRVDPGAQKVRKSAKQPVGSKSRRSA